MQLACNAKRSRFIGLSLVIVSLWVCGTKNSSAASFVEKLQKDSSHHVHTNWCVYQDIPWHEGYWTLYNNERLTGKRVALIVHGHNLDSILYAFVNYGMLKVFHHFNVPHISLYKPAPHYWYGLDTLVNLGRFLSSEVRMPGHPDQRRYEQVVGYAYSSVGTLKEISKRFASEASSFLKDAKSVDIFAHSMGGLVTRWALEKEGLGAKYKNLVTLASPHQGVPVNLKAVFGHFVPDDFISTLDMTTTTTSPDDPSRSAFMKELNDPVNPYFDTANYFTLVGNRFADLTNSKPPAFKPAPNSSSNAGSIIQKMYDMMFNNTVLSDGLVPTYSAASIVLKTKSKAWADDPSHKHTLPLNHLTITGSANTLNGVCPNSDATYQCMMTSVLRKWIDSFPVEP